MSLLDDIQAACLDSNVPLPDLLRRCKVLAAKLKNQEFANWVNNELNGYERDEDLPSYRILGRGPSKGTVTNGYQVLDNAPLRVADLPEELRNLIRVFKVDASVGTITEWLGRDTIAMQWPAELLSLFNHHSGQYPGAQVVQATTPVGVGSIRGILDTIRTRVLDFVLAIQAENPNAGEARANEPPPIAPATVTQHFHVTIHGGQAIVGSSGGQNAVGEGPLAQHSGSGDIAIGGPISQADYRKALGDVLAAVTAIREKLDVIHTDLFEYASDIVIKLRKLQLDGLTVPEVQAKVKEAFEDDTVKAMVKEMKPDALKRGMELLTTAASVANHPLSKAIVTGILAGLGAS